MKGVDNYLEKTKDNKGKNRNEYHNLTKKQILGFKELENLETAN